MARIKNPEKYIKQFKEDFEIVKRKLITNSYLLNEVDRSNLIDCLTQLENYLEDEMYWIIKEKDYRLG